MRKKDRFEDRARELAVAAGVDPDGRVERPGMRSMPAWCLYRDAARGPRSILVMPLNSVQRSGHKLPRIRTAR